MQFRIDLPVLSVRIVMKEYKIVKEAILNGN
jgi:hypothetical protein